MIAFVTTQLVASGAVVSCAVLGARGLLSHAIVAIAVPLVWWFA